jgi:hypothetical protein
MEKGEIMAFGVNVNTKTGSVQYWADENFYEIKLDTAFEERKRIIKLLKLYGFDDAIKLIKKGK